ncbi:MAG TPA: LytTR family DNA-binding domain-containing protein [Cyclobacteriaceae bacterium]|jgi:DNA-binding LytR/AlgR family response regulator|nr:LytTR family DNA-binding domain-containing protein [Cyclobacteriaceae bacterium]
MIKAIGVDDEPLPLEILETYCSTVDFISLERTFTQTNEAKKYLQSYPVDLIFLDIHMPSISGIDFYKDIEQNVMVIFTTAHSQYAVEGFNLSAIDYLMKPYSLERFQEAVNRANEYYNYLYTKSESSNHIFIRAEYSLVKIPVADILYVEGLADYIKIHLKEGKPVIARMTMKTILEKLPPEFIRVHRSFIIPLNRIDGVRNKTITMGSLKIPIGSSYREAFKKVYKP